MSFFVLLPDTNTATATNCIADAHSKIILDSCKIPKMSLKTNHIDRRTFEMKLLIGRVSVGFFIILTIARRK